MFSEHADDPRYYKNADVFHPEPEPEYTPVQVAVAIGSNELPDELFDGASISYSDDDNFIDIQLENGQHFRITVTEEKEPRST
jgi:hypothetical protein